MFAKGYRVLRYDIRGLRTLVGTDDQLGRRIRAIVFEDIDELTMDESDTEELDRPAIVRLSEAVVPTLVLPAEHDPPVRRRMSAALADGIPGARHIQSPETNHVVNPPRPDAFNPNVLAFLDEARP